MRQLQTTCEKIAERAKGLPEGGLICAKELLHLGNRAAIDQALHRLTRRGELSRVRRGVYVRPVQTRFGRRAPETSRVVSQLSHLRSEAIVPHGAAAANALGLTTQVPVRVVYLTSGRSGSLTIGGQKIELQHAPRKELEVAGKPGEAIRAMRYLGLEHVERIMAALSEAEKQNVVSRRAILPGAFAERVSAFANG